MPISAKICDRTPRARRSEEGFALDEEDKQALRSVDWSGSDEELKDRVSKGMRWC